MSTGASISAVVNNALAQFSFDGDARPKLGEVAWLVVPNCFHHLGTPAAAAASGATK